MFKSLILELAGNATCYMDGILMHNIEEYQENSDKFDKIIDKLCEKLSPEDKYKTVFDLQLAMGGMEAMTADEYFKHGFRLGLIMGAQNFLD
ncbi:MAG: hypothetical protein HDQ88_06705 [Clostridia bacterium]|nr:hypothetical protein [Clostridia bacterium]